MCHVTANVHLENIYIFPREARPSVARLLIVSFSVLSRGSLARGNRTESLYIYMGYWPSGGQDGWILAKFFFLRGYGPRRCQGKKQQSMICILAGQSPYPARSGSQSQCEIRFILPAHRARHIINIYIFKVCVGAHVTYPPRYGVRQVLSNWGSRLLKWCMQNVVKTDINSPGSTLMVCGRRDKVFVKFVVSVKFVNLYVISVFFCSSLFCLCLYNLIFLFCFFSVCVRVCSISLLYPAIIPIHIFFVVILRNDPAI